MYEKSRGLFRSMHNTLGEVMAATNLAEVDHERGMTDREIANVDQVLAKAEALPDGAPFAYLLRNKSAYLGAVGQPDAAIATGRRALEYYREHDPEGVFAAVTIEHIALGLALCGDSQSGSPACLRRRAHWETIVQPRIHGARSTSTFRRPGQ